MRRGAAAMAAKRAKKRLKLAEKLMSLPLDEKAASSKGPKKG
jgi:hypothetical protein